MASTRPPAGVPPALDRAAAVSWRVLLVGAAVLAALWALSHLMIVVVPVAVAVLAATVVAPPVDWLARRGLHRGVAAWLVLVAAVALLVGVTVALAPQVRSQFADLGTSLEEGVDEVRSWLSDGVFGLSPSDVERYEDRLADELRQRSGALAGGVVRGAFLAVEVIGGALLALVLVFFFVKDAGRITGWFLRQLADERREPVRRMGRAAWDALGGYIRGTALVGVVDAVVIGAGLLLIGVPLVLPLVLLTFVGAFFPLVGATVAGLAAALVALVSNGPVDALLVLGVVIVVQQVEGDVLAPFLVGRAVRLHPVVVLLSLTVGGVLAGIVGAFLAVPTAAVVVAAGAEWRRVRDGDPPGDRAGARGRAGAPEAA